MSFEQVLLIPGIGGKWTPLITTGQYARIGVVLEATLADEQGNCQEPNVLYTTTDSQIVGNPCFQMWYSGGLSTGKMFYAESRRGKVWTKHPTSILTAFRSFVYKEGSTYYMFTHAGSGLSIYSSDNPIGPWTVYEDNILPASATPGAWDFTGTDIQNICVWKEGATYYIMYELQDNNDHVYKLGLASASALDGTWTKYAGNPVVNNFPGSVSGPFVHKHANGKYYLYAHNSPTGLLPTDIIKYRSDDLHILTLYSPDEFTRAMAAEGGGNPHGQVDDCCALELNGVTYYNYAS